MSAKYIPTPKAMSMEELRNDPNYKKFRVWRDTLVRTNENGSVSYSPDVVKKYNSWQGNEWDKRDSLNAGRGITDLSGTTLHITHDTKNKKYDDYDAQSYAESPEYWSNPKNQKIIQGKHYRNLSDGLREKLIGIGAKKEREAHNVRTGEDANSLNSRTFTGRKLKNGEASTNGLKKGKDYVEAYEDELENGKFTPHHRFSQDLKNWEGDIIDADGNMRYDPRQNYPAEVERVRNYETDEVDWKASLARARDKEAGKKVAPLQPTRSELMKQRDDKLSDIFHSIPKSQWVTRGPFGDQNATLEKYFQAHPEKRIPEVPEHLGESVPSTPPVQKEPPTEKPQPKTKKEDVKPMSKKEEKTKDEPKKETKTPKKSAPKDSKKGKDSGGYSFGSEKNAFWAGFYSGLKKAKDSDKEEEK